MDGAEPKPLNMICSLGPIREHEHKLGQILLTHQPYLLGRYMREILNVDDMFERAADAPPGCQLAQKYEVAIGVSGDRPGRCVHAKQVRSARLLCLVHKNSLRLGEMVRS